MNKPSVLVGGPVCQEPQILYEYLESLLNLDSPGIALNFLLIDDNTNLESKALLHDFSSSQTKAEIIDMNNKDEYRRTEVSHKWEDKFVAKVSQFRNSMLNSTKQGEYDFLFMVDSDIIINPCTLKFLISQNTDIISEIFWTSWAPGGKEFPQVWLYDDHTQYDISKGRPASESEISIRTSEFLNMLRKPGIYKVGGLGACTLISRRAIDAGVTYSRIPNISFWGEDRHFCIRAAVLGFDLYVDTHFPAFHIYRKNDLGKAYEAKKRWGYIKYLQHGTFNL